MRGQMPETRHIARAAIKTDRGTGTQEGASGRGEGEGRGGGARGRGGLEEKRGCCKDKQGAMEGSEGGRQRWGERGPPGDKRHVLPGYGGPRAIQHLSQGHRTKAAAVPANDEGPVGPCGHVVHAHGHARQDHHRHRFVQLGHLPGQLLLCPGQRVAAAAVAAVVPLRIGHFDVEAEEQQHDVRLVHRPPHRVHVHELRAGLRSGRLLVRRDPAAAHDARGAARVGPLDLRESGWKATVVELGP